MSLHGSSSGPRSGVAVFWHWFNFHPNDDDYGHVQIRAVGDTDWITLAEYRNSGGGTWTLTFVSLADYAGQTVEITFYFHSDRALQREGRYIDDILLEGVFHRIHARL